MKKLSYIVICVFIAGLSLGAADVKKEIAMNSNAFVRAKEKLGTIITANSEFIGTRNRENFEPYLEKQTPSATVVMCSDSRVQPASLHDNPKGHLFTIRNIGNQIDSNEGSVDYGVLVLKTPLLLVLGHTGCGAVNAVMKGYSDVPESIKDELDTIDIGDAKGEKEALQNNINSQIEVALEKYKDLIEKKELFVVGAIYDLHNIFGYGYGALVFTNVNGDVSAIKIKSSRLFADVEDLKVVK